MSGHTPGPWRVDDDYGSGEFSIETPDENIGPIGTYGARRLGEANASLIAAAPELLDELQRSQDVLHGLIEYFDEGHERRDIYAQLARNSAAIAKAQGPRCDHKFIDSTSCLKCGWTPPAPDVVDRSERRG